MLREIAKTLAIYIKTGSKQEPRMLGGFTRMLVTVINREAENI